MVGLRIALHWGPIGKAGLGASYRGMRKTERFNTAPA
jgi:hypothetical protein